LCELSIQEDITTILQSNTQNSNDLASSLPFIP
jgi:hypothetical protein